MEKRTGIQACIILLYSSSGNHVTAGFGRWHRAQRAVAPINFNMLKKTQVSVMIIMKNKTLSWHLKTCCLSDDSIQSAKHGCTKIPPFIGEYIRKAGTFASISAYNGNTEEIAEETKYLLQFLLVLANILHVLLQHLLNLCLERTRERACKQGHVYTDVERVMGVCPIQIAPSVPHSRIEGANLKG